MTPEEYQRLKEAEKEHLRSLRKLKQAVRTMERQKKLTDAIENATRGPMDALDDHDALVNELAIETAKNEARLDVALESIASESPPDMTAQDEEALRKARAAELVRQLRGSSQASPAAADAAKAGSGPGQNEKEAKPAPPPPLPEKTIGRMKP